MIAACVMYMLLTLGEFMIRNLHKQHRMIKNCVCSASYLQSKDNHKSSIMPPGLPTFPGVYFKGGSLIMGTGYLRGGLCNLVGAIYYFLKQPEDVINSSFKN